MDSNLLFYGFTTIFYLFCAVKILFDVKNGKEPVAFWILGLTALAVIVHFWVLQSGIFVATQTIQLGIGSLISAIVFFSVLVLLFGSLYGQGQSLLAIALLISSVSVWAPFLFPATMPAITNPSPATKIHLALGVVAYSFSLMAVIEVLRTHSMDGFFPRFLNASFIFLTLTLLTGALSIDNYFDRLMAGDQSALLTFVAWLCFGFMILARKVLSSKRLSFVLLFGLGIVAQVVTLFSYG